MSKMQVKHLTAVYLLYQGLEPLPSFRHSTLPALQTWDLGHNLFRLLLNCYRIWTAGVTTSRFNTQVHSVCGDTNSISDTKDAPFIVISDYVFFCVLLKWPIKAKNKSIPVYQPSSKYITKNYFKHLLVTKHIHDVAAIGSTNGLLLWSSCSHETYIKLLSKQSH